MRFFSLSLLRGMAHHKAFEKRMNKLGFSRRITVYDFFSESEKKSVNSLGFKHRWKVGIWLNYQKKLIALRPDGDACKEIVIPFDKIFGIEMIEDGSMLIAGGIVVIEPVEIVNNRAKEINKGLHVKIIAGDVNNAAKGYILYFPDPVNDANFYMYKKCIKECTWSIISEIITVNCNEWCIESDLQPSTVIQ